MLNTEEKHRRLTAPNPKQGPRMRDRVKRLSPLLVVLTLACWPLAHAYADSNDARDHDAAWIALTGSSAAPDFTNASEPSHYYSHPIPKIRERAENSAGHEFPFQLYVTPEDPVIKALAAQTDTAQDAYKVAVQWVYVSEQKLNHTPEKWLTPHEFLTNTPDYPTNPVKGEQVSDCEEQVHALVSVLRANGVPPEEVRVALGEVRFGDVETGHAWVELQTNGYWLALDPTCGPYWDDKAGKLVPRRGDPFDYYVSHAYPVLLVHAYYNDIYYLDPRGDSGNAPASWCKAVPAK